MSSQYQPQLKNWREDLGGGYGIGLVSNTDCIAYANDNYCEIYRKREFGGACVALGFLFLFNLFLIFSGIAMLTAYHPLIGLFIIDLIILFIVNWAGRYVIFHFLRAYYAPASSPIRFNRQTSKVYFYENVAMKYGFQFFIPRKAFKDLKKYEIKVYDWGNIQAVLHGATRVLHAGGTIDNYHLICVGCKPKTKEVIDHFWVAKTNQYGGVWGWINTFMQYRLEKPIDQNGLKYVAYGCEDKQSFVDVEPRRKVISRQIEGLDKASKAGSKEELTQIEQEYQLTENVYPVYE